MSWPASWTRADIDFSSKRRSSSLSSRSYWRAGCAPALFFLEACHSVSRSSWQTIVQAARLPFKLPDCRSSRRLPTARLLEFNTRFIRSRLTNGSSIERFLIHYERPVDFSTVKTPGHAICEFVNRVRDALWEFNTRAIRQSTLFRLSIELVCARDGHYAMRWATEAGATSLNVRPRWALRPALRDWDGRHARVVRSKRTSCLALGACGGRCGSRCAIGASIARLIGALRDRGEHSTSRWALAWTGFLVSECDSAPIAVDGGRIDAAIADAGGMSVGVGNAKAHGG